MGVDAVRHLRFERFEYSAQATAKTMESSLKEKDALVYNFSGNELRRELFYLPNETITVTDSLSPEELPDTIYVIGTESKPVRICTDSVRYKWEALSQEILIKDKKLVVYLGEVVIDQSPSPKIN